MPNTGVRTKGKQNRIHGVGPWKYDYNLKDEFFQEVSFRTGNGKTFKILVGQVA